HMYYKVLNARDFGVPQDRNRMYMVGFKHPVNYAAARAGEIQRIYLNSKKAQTELGWKPTYDFTTGLKKTVDWFRANPNWYG
ncbi:MAG: DNA cytosine methyltransferase, partial [bacterium]